mgnify:FL=1
MNNIQFVSSETMDDFIYNNWKTDFFKNLQKKEGSVVDLMITRLKEKGLFVFDYSNDLEYKHMFLWFYHIGHRQYDNPYIHDLFFFHEFYHLISFPEKKFDNFEEWKSAMWQNELEASLMSEVFIYYFEPELRQYTFKQRIWCDDVIEMFGYEHVNATDDILMFKGHNEVFNKITARREQLRAGLESTIQTEDWIRNFNNKDDWFVSWKGVFYTVECIRNDFEQMVKKDPELASKNLIQALINNSTHGTPFYETAIENRKMSMSS